MFVTRLRALGQVEISRLLTGFLILFLVMGLFVWHLGSLTAGLSPREATARANSSSLSLIRDNPVNAPHRLVQLLAQSNGYHGATSMRLVSVFFSLIFLICLYTLLSRRFGRLMSFLGVVTLAGTPLLITITRSAAPDIMMLSPLLVLASYQWLVSTKRQTGPALICLSLAILICFYTPGGPLTLCLLAGLSYKRWQATMRRASLHIAYVALSILILGVIPLAWSVGNHPEIARTLFNLPDHWTGLSPVFKNMLWFFPSLVLHTRGHNEYLIGNLAVLSATQIALVIFGLYAVLTKNKSEGLKTLLIAAPATLAFAVNGSDTPMLVILPVVTLFVCAGLTYLHKEWRTVFPINPIPKALSLGLMIILVSLQLVWGVQYSLVAWPHTELTKELYVIK